MLNGLNSYWFGEVNSRPLSLFRIGLALVLLKEALFHLPLAEVFYSDSGVVTRTAIWELVFRPGRFSLMDFLPASWMVVLFFLSWAAVAVCLLIGLHTRLMSILNFVITLSVYERNPFIVNGADDILRLLSFWAMFIPLNHFYAVDAARRAGRVAQTTAYAFPVRLIQLQIALIYLAAGIFKLLGETWLDGTALSNVLQLESWLLPLGQWLAANSPDWLLRLITYSVVFVEMAFPILVFIPLGQPILRTLGLLLVGLMHLGIALTAPLMEFLLVLGVSYFLFFAQSIPAQYSVQARVRSIWKPILTVFLGLLMLLVLWKNADNFRQHNAMIVPAMPLSAVTVLNAAGLHQGWDLFSPSPVKVDWSIAVLGTFADNTTYELRTGSAPRVALIPIRLGPEYRWKQLELIVAQSRSVTLLEAWGKYYCHLYNATRKESLPSLATVQIQLMYRYAHAPKAPSNPVESDVLWIQQCDSD